jgi:hypothetical protein
MQVKYTHILKCVEAFQAIIHKFDIWEQNRTHKEGYTLQALAELLHSCSVTPEPSEQ